MRRKEHIYLNKRNTNITIHIWANNEDDAYRKLVGVSKVSDEWKLIMVDGYPIAKEAMIVRG